MKVDRITVQVRFSQGTGHKALDSPQGSAESTVAVPQPVEQSIGQPEPLQHLSISARSTRPNTSGTAGATPSGTRIGHQTASGAVRSRRRRFSG